MLRATLSSSDYVYPTVLPWRTIFDDLSRAGQTPYRVANLIGYSWSTVQRWYYDGVEPRESAARAILELHKRFCGEELTDRRKQEVDLYKE